MLGWAHLVFQKIDPTCSIIGSPSLASYASSVVVDPEVVDTAKAAKRDEVKTAAMVAVRAADNDPKWAKVMAAHIIIHWISSITRSNSSGNFQLQKGLCFLPRLDVLLIEAKNLFPRTCDL